MPILHSEWETFAETVQYKFTEYMDAEPCIQMQKLKAWKDTLPSEDEQGQKRGFKEQK